MPITIVEKKNPNALAQLEALALKVVLAMGDEGAEVLKENLSPGPRSGVHYPGQPRVSSAPGEYSQSQTDTLRQMVDSKQLGPNVVGAGFFPKSVAERMEAEAQEYGAPRNNLVGRANGRRTFQSPATHQRMIARGKKEV